MDSSLQDFERQLRGMRPASPPPELRRGIMARLAARRCRRLFLRAAALLVAGCGAYSLWLCSRTPASAPVAQVAVAPGPPSVPVPSPPTKGGGMERSLRLVRVTPVGPAVVRICGTPVRPVLVQSVDDVLWRDPENSRRTIRFVSRQNRLVSLPLRVQ